jgi:hypothetical protein
MRPVYFDSVGDAGARAPDWIDMQRLLGHGGYLAGPIAAIPDPSETWFAMGVVLDMDRDGVGDLRVGMDNAGPDGSNRSWIANLATGEVHASPTLEVQGFGVSIDAYPLDAELNDDGNPDTTAGIRIPKGGDVPFYFWSSLIVDGGIVATDYAPDVGWIDMNASRPSAQ